MNNEPQLYGETKRKGLRAMARRTLIYRESGSGALYAVLGWDFLIRGVMDYYMERALEKKRHSVAWH